MHSLGEEDCCHFECSGGSEGSRGVDEHSGMRVWNHNKLGAPGFAFTAEPLLAMCKNSVVYNVAVATESPPNNSSVTFVNNAPCTGPPLAQGSRDLQGPTNLRGLVLPWPHIETKPSISNNVSFYLLQDVWNCCLQLICNGGKWVWEGCVCNRTRGSSVLSRDFTLSLSAGMKGSGYWCLLCVHMVIKIFTVWVVLGFKLPLQSYVTAVYCTGLMIHMGSWQWIQQ